MNALMIANTQIRRDRDGRYCLNDLHQASGAEKRHIPSYWLALGKTQELVSEIEFGEPVGNLTTGIPVVKAIVATEGRAGGTYAVKELVYAYAMWINAKFHLHVIRAYDAMVTGDRATTAPALPDAATHRADVMVSASRSFSALVRAGRTMGLQRDRAIVAANAATRRITGIDLADELGVTDKINAATTALAIADTNDPSTAVAAFHHALQAGDIPLPYVPCMSREAFYVYQHRCKTTGETPLTLPRFIHQLTHAQGVKLERKRYSAGGETYGPAAMLMWGYNRKANETEVAYLGRTNTQFAEASAKYLLGFTHA
jgi:hypothetical protein